MQVKDILERVTLLYNDIDYGRMTQQQYIQLIDDAVLQVAILRPDAHSETRVLELQEGFSQSIPADAHVLMDIPYCVTEGIYTPVRQVLRYDLDSFSSWTSIEPSTLVEEYAYDPKTPRKFFVYPPAQEGAKVQADLGIVPQRVASLADPVNATINLPEVFFNPLVSYVLYLLYSSDSTSATDRAVAATYESTFFKQLAAQGQAADIAAPRTAAAAPTDSKGGKS